MKKKEVQLSDNRLIRRLLQTKPAVILSNWIFQGMRYMSNEERIVKLVIDIVLMLIIMLVSGSISIKTVMISFIIAHTLNWIANGHIFVLMRYIYPVHKDMKDFERVIEVLRKKSGSKECIDSLAIYGSYARKSIHSLSDLDVRVITKTGWANRLCGAIFCLKMRLWALVHAFPLDIYTYSDLRALDRLRNDEAPVVIKDSNERLLSYYK